MNAKRTHKSTINICVTQVLVSTSPISCVTIQRNIKRKEEEEEEEEEIKNTWKDR